jgi:hypothetical protein
MGYTGSPDLILQHMWILSISENSVFPEILKNIPSIHPRVGVLSVNCTKVCRKKKTQKVVPLTYFGIINPFQSSKLIIIALNFYFIFYGPILAWKMLENFIEFFTGS